MSMIPSSQFAPPKLPKRRSLTLWVWMDMENDQWVAEYANIPRLGDVDHPTRYAHVNHADAMSGATHKLHHVVLLPTLAKGESIPWVEPDEDSKPDECEVRSIAVAY